MAQCHVRVLMGEAGGPESERRGGDGGRGERQRWERSEDGAGPLAQEGRSLQKQVGKGYETTSPPASRRNRPHTHLAVGLQHL